MVVQLSVPSMVCAGCVDTVTKAIQALDSQADVQVNLETKVVTAETQISKEALTEAIQAVGHTVA